MTGTGVGEAKTAQAAWGWAKRMFALVKRIATLEERVSALEQTVSKRLPNGCPFCGERAMRLTTMGRAMGGGTGQWRQDVWTCEKCGKQEEKIARLAD